MYDMTKIPKRTWEIVFVDGRKLSILPPKIKNRNEMVELLNDKEDYLLSLAKCVSMIASNNKDGITILQEEVNELLDEEEMTDFVDNFTNWLTGVVSEKN